MRELDGTEILLSASRCCSVKYVNMEREAQLFVKYRFQKLNMRYTDAEKCSLALMNSQAELRWGFQVGD